MSTGRGGVTGAEGADVIDPIAVGKRLTTVRDALGVNPATMADGLGIDRSVWLKYEKGERIIPYDKAARLVERYNLSLDYIILGDSSKLSVETKDWLLRGRSW